MKERITVALLLIGVMIGGGYLYRLDQEWTQVQTDNTRRKMVEWVELAHTDVKSAFSNPCVDAWGNGCYLCGNKFVSSGPDGHVGTSDDIEVPYSVEKKK